jgi:hypothetical protein
MCELPVYIDDENLLGKYIHMIKKNTEALLDTSEKLDLDVDRQKSKHMFMSHQQNAYRTNNIQIANNFFKNVAQFNIWEQH